VSVGKPTDMRLQVYIGLLEQHHVEIGTDHCTETLLERYSQILILSTC